MQICIQDRNRFFPGKIFLFTNWQSTQAVLMGFYPILPTSHPHTHRSTLYPCIAVDMGTTSWTQIYSSAYCKDGYYTGSSTYGATLDYCKVIVFPLRMYCICLPWERESTQVVFSFLIGIHTRGPYLTDFFSHRRYVQKNSSASIFPSKPTPARATIRERETVRGPDMV